MDIKKYKCEFCHKESSAPCVTQAQSSRCSRMIVKVRQTVLRFFKLTK